MDFGKTGEKAKTFGRYLAHVRRNDGVSFIAHYLEEHLHAVANWSEILRRSLGILLEDNWQSYGMILLNTPRSPKTISPTEGTLIFRHTSGATRDSDQHELGTRHTGSLLNSVWARTAFCVFWIHKGNIASIAFTPAYSMLPMG